MIIRKALVLGAAAGSMLAAAASSQAVSITFATVSPVSAGPTGGQPGNINWTLGVNSNTTRFTNVLNPTGQQTIFDQSQIQYGLNNTFDNGTGNVTDSFSAAKSVYFDYSVTINGQQDFFRVVGDASGTMTFNTVQGSSSLAKWTPGSFFESATEGSGYVSVPFVATLDPVTGAPSDEIKWNIGGVLTDIFIYQQNPLTAPIEPGFPTPSPASVNGYILAVPEPSSLALLMCSGIAGSMLLWRRRRA